MKEWLIGTLVILLTIFGVTFGFYWILHCFKDDLGFSKLWCISIVLAMFYLRIGEKK